MNSDTQKDTHAAEAARLIARLQQTTFAAGADRIAANEWLRVEAGRQQLANAFAKKTTITFSVGPRWIALGVDGLLRQVRNPGLAGIDAAVAVFAGRQTGMLRTAPLMARPNALRNSLARAARWADDQHAAELAQCIRAISIEATGGINFETPPGIELRLKG